MLSKIKEIFSPRDMTEGAPWKRILEFSMPMLIGNFAQQLYNTVDTIVVGKYVGDSALEAVGSTMPILNLLLALFVGIATGAGIVISQSYGAKMREALNRNIGSCLALSLVATVVIMLIGPFIVPPLLKVLSTPDYIFADCQAYLNIYFVGIVGFFFYNMMSGILRGLGDSFSALLFLIISAGLNVVLDIWFVAGFKMGVPGVALATVLAQGISAILCYIKLLAMRDVFDLKLKYLKVFTRESANIIRLGVPSGITQSIFSMAGVLVQSLANKMGVIACNIIIMRVDGFAMLPNMTFGQAMSVYVGQNVGAQRLDRVKDGTKQGTVMAIAFSTVITGILLIFGRGLFGLFTETQSLITLAVSMMNVLAVGYICVSVTQSLGGVMRGAGDTVTPMWITMICNIVLRVPLAYALASFTKSEVWPHGEPIALFASLLASWVMGMVFTLIAYRFGKWREKMKTVRI